jgi:hypothetical protein|tara:strand:- start:1819 stop:6207 length:4389 start_codon:yes stop_codon:yes gene_type:complete
MALDRFFNQDDVLSKGPTYGQDFDNGDQALLNANKVKVPFTQVDVTGIPGISNAVLEKHFYAGASLVASGESQITTIGDEQQGYTVYVKPEQDARAAGFNQGTYSVVYNFLHKLPNVKITEISGDRTEIKVTGVGPTAQGGLEQFAALYNNLPPAGSNSFTLNDRYTPVMINLGGNQLIPVTNAIFDGQIVGEQEQFLPYPPGDTPNSIWFPVNDNALEAGLNDQGETDFNTFTEVIVSNYWKQTQPNLPNKWHFEVTGKFDEFKIKQNPDTTLSWVRKFSLASVTTSGSLPQDVDEELMRASVELAGYYNQGSPGGGVGVHLSAPSQWSVKYTSLNPNLTSIDEAIIKLYTPLPDSISVNDTIGASVQLQKSYIDRVILFKQLENIQTDFFSDPNFNIDLDDNKGSSGDFETWQSLLDAGSPTQQKIIDKFFSGSLGNVKLNIDYSDFKNFINFSSAEERVRNYYYKLQQIEAFDRRIGVLNNVSGSEALVNISSSARRRDELKGTFDDFEYWLHYNHDSNLYTHFSSSEFRIDPYPKQTRNPDVLYHSTSSQGSNWFNTTIASASLYDAQNPTKLRGVIPINLADDKLNEEYITFVDMLGQHFDISWNYIKSLTTINEREEHPKDGLANDLIDIIASSFGWKLFNGYSDVGLWQYEFGINQSGNPIQSGSLYSKPTKEIVHETWRRLLNNLPGIYKTKGTARSFKTLIASYGIPSAFLKIREYGGPRVSEDKNVYEHERYVYKLQLDGKNRGEHIWDTINGHRPKTIEYVGKLPKANHTVYRLNQKDGGQIDLHWDYVQTTQKARLRLRGGSPLIQISSSYFPYVKERDVVIGFSSASGGYHLEAAYIDDFGDILATPTASTTSNNWNFIWNSSGSSDNNKLMSPYLGTTSTASIQEIRYYKKKLSAEVIQGHAANREAYFSDDNTTDLDIDTSYENVLYRIFPDSTFNSVSGSISSRHPNQHFTASDRGFILSASYEHGQPEHLSGESDTYFVSIPSVGALNLSNNKVRIESSSLQGPLQHFKTNEVSQYDQAPNDSNLLGTYFSTTDQVNFDIYASEGYFSVDDLIGDTDVRNIDGYDLLDFRARNYFQKYNRGTALNILIGMLSRYDMSIFDSMKQIVPARADWHKGILIEPHVFERNNFKRPDNIDYTQHQFSSNGVSILNVVSGSYLTYTASLERDVFKPSIYKFTDIALFNTASGEYFTGSNGYWEYSPTGSTILDSRLSRHALEPRYFYSTEESASLGITFANSASFHFAQVQDDRLTGNLNNLFYLGCRITSDSLTTNSPDTPDNSPVVEVIQSDPDILVFNTDGITSQDEVKGKDPEKLVKVVDPSLLVAVDKFIQANRNPSNDSVAVTKGVEDQIFRPMPFQPPKQKAVRPKVRPRGKSTQVANLGGRRVGVNRTAFNEAINRAARRPGRMKGQPNGIFNQTNPNTTGAASPNTALGEFTRNNSMNNRGG